MLLFLFNENFPQFSGKYQQNSTLAHLFQHNESEEIFRKIPENSGKFSENKQVENRFQTILHLSHFPIFPKIFRIFSIFLKIFNKNVEE